MDSCYCPLFWSFVFVCMQLFLIRFLKAICFAAAVFLGGESAYPFHCRKHPALAKHYKLPCSIIKQNQHVKYSTLPPFAGDRASPTRHTSARARAITPNPLGKRHAAAPSSRVPPETNNSGTAMTRVFGRFKNEKGQGNR